jgi:neutral ceramidase
MRVNSATVDITPSDPIPLAGYGSRTGKFVCVDSRLEANIVRFTDAAGANIVLCGVDTLFIGLSVKHAIVHAARMSPDQLILLPTHTHCAPSLVPEAPRLGDCDPAYTALVVRRIGDVLRVLQEDDGIPVSVGHARRHAPLNIGRRRPSWVFDYDSLRKHGQIRFGKVVALAPYSKGVVDRTLSCIALRDSAGVVRSVIWSFPCHPAFYPFANHVSADFPGLVRECLRGIYGPACAVIYLPGLAGSAIPDMPLTLPRSLIDLLHFLLPFHPQLRRFTPEGFRAWANRLATEALSCVRDTRSAEIESVTYSCTRSLPVFMSDSKEGIFVSGEPVRLDVVRLEFGTRCGIIFATGEIIGEWTLVLRSYVPEEHILTGYLAGPPLYVPTDGAVSEGGYEADGFRHDFGLSGTFVSGLERIVIDAIVGVDKRSTP